MIETNHFRKKLFYFLFGVLYKSKFPFGNIGATKLSNFFVRYETYAEEQWRLVDRMLNKSVVKRGITGRP